MSSATPPLIYFATGNKKKLEEVWRARYDRWDRGTAQKQGVQFAAAAAALHLPAGPLSNKCGGVPGMQVVQILEAGHKLPFEVRPAAVDLPELQGEPEEIAAQKCRLAATELGAAGKFVCTWHRLLLPEGQTSACFRP